MYTPPKLKYSPEKLYKSDINDLVEDDVVKGGPGSGVKGHKTAKKRKDSHSEEKFSKLHSEVMTRLTKTA